MRTIRFKPSSLGRLKLLTLSAIKHKVTIYDTSKDRQGRTGIFTA